MPKQAVVKPIAETAEVSVDHLSNLERSLSIVVPVSQIEEKEAEEFKKLSQNAQVKGYRKGKVPLPMLKKLYASSVHEEVIRKLVDQHLSDALKKNELNPVGGIQIESLEAEPGNPLKIKATFEVSPKVELIDISQLALEKFKVDISDADINQKIEDLRVRQATWLPTEEAAQKGNQVKIDYEGELDGKGFPGGSNQNVTLKIGEEVMIAGFEDKLIGAKAGDTLSFDVTFPADYGIKELEGKTAHFKVKVHEVSVIQLPELDDNFAKKLDVQDGLEALKQKLKEFMLDEIQQVTHENLKYQIVEQLTEKHPLDLPKALVDAEIKAMQERVRQQFANMMKDGSFPELSREYFEKQAGKKVAIGLIFSELVKKYDLKPDQASLQKRIEAMTSAYNVNAETLMKWLASNENARQQLTVAVLEDQVIDKVLEQAQIKEKVTNYRDATQWKPEEAQ